MAENFQSDKNHKPRVPRSSMKLKNKKHEENEVVSLEKMRLKYVITQLFRSNDRKKIVKARKK